jgi:pimeloyl-ACP methyl ester carboxylesterase
MMYSKLLILLAALTILPSAPAFAADHALAVEDAQFVDINGQQQWVTIRGTKRDNPVLLVLHGGPGFAMSTLAPMYSDWEQDFTVVQWDQPLSGGTALKNLGNPGPATIDRYTRDGLAVTEWVEHHLGVKRVVLLGTSWGSLLGVEMVQRRPELFSAYVGTAQPVGAEGARVGYELALEAARKRGDTAGVADLMRIGPPPYKTFEDFLVRQKYSNNPGLPPTPEQAAAIGELMPLLLKPDSKATYIAPVAAPPGYDGGFMAALQATWKETWSWEARHLSTQFKVPVFIFQGDVDYNTPTSVARTYFNEIRAPAKAFEVVPNAGHDIILFHGELLKLLRKDVLPVITKNAS